MRHSLLAEMLGVYIVDQRKSRRITQARLAEMLGCSAQFLGRIEKGEVMMPDHMLETAIGAIGLDYGRMKKIYRLSAENRVDELFSVAQGRNKKKSRGK